ncbi:hypothetical protein [Alienimonas californiensis]|uniref:Uncharacterized protein n=1 Tax=Alienimonas californiensis TaxID=2527989 RepID=A0A517P8W1_9PLAN|nr:hypothetical protein [Alienimonas californiensis]QDT15795.1 hypothetical protein CA12_18890 [Alienimonas californiensis]
MQPADAVTLRFAVGIGLAAVWVTPLVAAARRRGGALFRPPGWSTLIAAGACGLAAAALTIGAASFWSPWVTNGWGHAARQQDAAERGAALLAAAAQGLCLLALVFAWRGWESTGPTGAPAASATDDEPNPLDAPFPPRETPS